MSSRIIRFESQSLRQQRDRNRGVFREVRMCKRLSAQYEVVCLKAPGTSPSHTIELGAPQVRLNRPDDALRDLVLECEDVIELPVITLDPDQLSALGITELRGNPDSLAGLADTSFQQIAHAQFASDSFTSAGRFL